MLIADTRPSPRAPAAAVEGIRNYYEQLVLEEIRRQLGDARGPDFAADVACVALNHLPPRYIRHTVDMAFYLSPREAEEMEAKVTAAVSEALQFVEQRTRSEA